MSRKVLSIHSPVARLDIFEPMTVAEKSCARTHQGHNPSSNPDTVFGFLPGVAGGEGENGEFRITMKPRDKQVEG